MSRRKEQQGAAAAGATGGGESIDSSQEDNEFVPEQLDKKYICPICLGVLSDPVQTKCGHRLCSNCMKKLAGPHRFIKCPIDKISIDYKNDVFKDNAMKREIGSQSVSCVSKQNGCLWTGEYRNLQDHIKVCNLSSVACKHGCGDVYLRKDEYGHSKSCLHRQTSCSYCCLKVKYIELENHEQTDCKKYLVKCEKCEKDKIPREEFLMHIDLKDGDCPEILFPCNFMEFGCETKVKRIEFQRHLDDSMANHLQLLGQCLSEQKKVIETQAVEILQFKEVAQIYNIRKLIQERKKIEELEKKVDTWENTSYTGKILWKINMGQGNNISRPNRSRSAATTAPMNFESRDFYTGKPGYKIGMILELRGHTDASDTYSSLFLVLKRGSCDHQLLFPFNAMCNITVFKPASNLSSGGATMASVMPMAQQDFNVSFFCKDVHHLNSGRQEPSSELALTSHKRGLRKFMKTQEILTHYTHNNIIYMQVEVVPVSPSSNFSNFRFVLTPNLPPALT